MYHNFAEVKIALSSGKSVLDIVGDYLRNIEQNKDLNAFLEVFEDSVRQQATAVDLKIKSGNAGKLAGLVVGIKDNICFKGHKVSASSKILEGFESLYTATALQRLIDEDAVVIGRLNCDEFAMGSSNENSAFGPVLNPVNKKTLILDMDETMLHAKFLANDKDEANDDGNFIFTLQSEESGSADV